MDPEKPPAMLAYILLAAAISDGGATQNRPGTQQARIDVIELNHWWPPEQSQASHQLIFWQRCRHTGELLPLAWKSVDMTGRAAPLIELPNRKAGILQCRATFVQDNVIRHVRATSFVETWTDFDRESENRDRVLSRGIRQNTLFEDRNNDDTAPAAATPCP